MDFSAKGLRVLVTAGGAGIGRAMAQTFLEHGARVHICDIDEKALAQARNKFPAVSQSRADVAFLETTSLRSSVSAQDIANMALYLCTEPGKRITGQALPVDADVRYLV